MNIVRRPAFSRVARKGSCLAISHASVAFETTEQLVPVLVQMQDKLVSHASFLFLTRKALKADTSEILSINSTRSVGNSAPGNPGFCF